MIGQLNVWSMLVLVNSVHVDDWTAEWVIITSYVNSVHVDDQIQIQVQQEFKACTASNTSPEVRISFGMKQPTVYYLCIWSETCFDWLD